MSLHDFDLIKVIQAHTGYQCFLDVVPESEPLPAIAITSIGLSPSVDRELSGDRVGDAVESRLSLICSSMSDMVSLVKKIELLDNTKNEYFQRITVDFSSREPYDHESSVNRVFYNLTSTR